MRLCALAFTASLLSACSFGFFEPAETPVVETTAPAPEVNVPKQVCWNDNPTVAEVIQKVESELPVHVSKAEPALAATLLRIRDKHADPGEPKAHSVTIFDSPALPIIMILFGTEEGCAIGVLRMPREHFIVLQQLSNV